MIDIVIKNIFPNDVIEIVKQLKNKGHVQGVDFDFAYNPPRFDNFSGESVYERSAIFTFYKEELATWFSLTYL